MFRCKTTRVCLLALPLFLYPFVLTRPICAQETDEPPVRIGMVSTLFTDVPAPLAQFILQPFGLIMREFSGMNGKMVLGGDPMTLGKQVHEGKVDLGVFHGIEFAWAQSRYKDLRPLMVAVTKYKFAQAVVVVKKDGPIESFNNLRGKSMALPQRSREHCRLFLTRNCDICGQANPKEYFSQLLTPASVETALDDVCLGTAQAAVVDLVALEQYQDIKPGCANRLKVLRPSERFPTGVICYREGAIADRILTKFRDGLCAANETERGREMMGMFKITSFEPVPEDYAQMLSDIMKIYPPPAPEVSPVSSSR
jgi:ABC-type phosphate/phosphonate transport system substrate-binding protein